ncbi:MAG: hypothetical protein JOZ55_05285 [Alphaproteobacteria bacterium]|nr:hypothetical protein [Alphaproteobacteria bacterium]
MACLFSIASARAETLVVVEARGIGSTAGQQMDSSAQLSLRRGEHVRLIGQNGNQYCLDGPYSGPALPVSAQSAASHTSLFDMLTGRAGTTADPLTDCIR